MKKLFFILIGIILLILVILFFFFVLKTTKENSLKKITPAVNSALYNNTEENNQIIIDKLKEGLNDEELRSALYWLSHRYSDNGGDIYEIINFVESHKELAFLQEAYSIYPESYALVTATSGKVRNNSIPSRLILYGYMEVSDKYNYSNSAMLATYANKTAETAIDIQNNHNNIQSSYTIKDDLNTDRLTSKSLSSFNKLSNEIENIFNKNKQSLSIKNDAIVTLNQYAAAQVGYKKLKVEYTSKRNIDEVWNFSINLAKELDSELYLFSNYMYVSEKINLSETDNFDISKYLKEIYGRNYSEAIINSKASLISKIILSKTKKGESIYNSARIKKMAELDPLFKQWLMKFGWTENDFQNIK